MIRLSFEAPIPHAVDFTDLSDFRVARAEWTMKDPKYREKVKPIDLLLAEPMPLTELRRVVALAKPGHVTISGLSPNPAQARGQLNQISIGVDCEIALVVPIGDAGPLELATVHDVSIIAFPPDELRVTWLRVMQRANRLPNDQWYHFIEVASPEELKAIVGMRLPKASLHTAKPVKCAFYDCDLAAAGELPDLDPYQKLTAEQVARAKELMTAMRDVCQ